MADATVAAGSASAPASASSSHQAILKSTAVIGGSSVVNIVFAVIRNKAVAMLVGADGIGLMGLFSAILDLAQTLAGFGLQSSGVRQTAEADASADPQRFASTTRALRLTSLVLAIIGAVFMVVAATPVATVTFADSGYATAVAFLGLAVFCRVIGAGQAALIQGVRHISRPGHCWHGGRSTEHHRLHRLRLRLGYARNHASGRCRCCLRTAADLVVCQKNRGERAQRQPTPRCGQSPLCCFGWAPFLW